MMHDRAKKVEEKAIKYRPLVLKLKQQQTGYEVQQCNIIIDALGGWLKDVEETKKLRGCLFLADKSAFWRRYRKPPFHTRYI